MREMKFRAWLPVLKEMTYAHTLQELINFEELGRCKEITWLQYTGLTDKNGTEIYEGDIVCTPYVDCIFGDMVSNVIDSDFKWVVIYKDGCFCVKNEDKTVYLHSFSKDGNIEVIGNIYENVELLK